VAAFFLFLLVGTAHASTTEDRLFDLLSRLSTSPNDLSLRYELGEVYLDYQNPKILPFRKHFFNTRFNPKDKYLQKDALRMTGLFYRFTNLTKYFDYADVHHPSHRSYVHLYEDKQVQGYVRTNTQFISFKNTAKKDSRDNVFAWVEREDNTAEIFCPRPVDSADQNLPAAAHTS